MPELLPALANRRASRAFADRKVEHELQELLWKAISVAPSHGNTQPTRILVARSPETREALIAVISEGNRNWAPAAPLLFAIAAVPSHDTTPQDFGGTTREVWAMHAGIAIGNLMAQATSLGLIAHPMAGFDEPGVRTVFGAPDDVRIVAVVAAGYPGDPATLPEDLARKETAPQDRLALDHILAFDRWGDANAVSARELRRRNR